MTGFTTFASADPAADAELLRARVTGQDEMLDYLERPIISHLVDRVTRADTDLKSVYRPLVRTAGEMADDQRRWLQDVTVPIRDHLAQRLRLLAADMNTVASALPGETRRQFYQSPIAPGTPDYCALPVKVLPVGTREVTATDGKTYSTLDPSGLTPDGTKVVIRYRAILPPPAPGFSPVIVGEDCVNRVFFDPAGEPSVPLPQGQPPAAPQAPPVAPPAGPCAAVCPAPVVNVTVNCADHCPPTTPPEPTECEEGTGPGTDIACVPKEEEELPELAVCPPDGIGDVLTRPLPGDPACGTAPPALPAPPRVVEPWITTAPNLCLRVEEYVRAFKDTGDAVARVVVSTTEALADIAGLIGRLKDIRFVGDLFKIVAIPAEVVERVLRAVARIMMVEGRAWLGANADTLIGLYFTRGILRALNSTQVGVNFVVQGGVQFEVLPEQLIQICDYLIQYLAPIKIPELGEINKLFLGGMIDRPQAECMAAMHGRQKEEWYRNMWVDRMRPTPDILMLDWFRWRTPIAELHRQLSTYGMISALERETFIRASQFLPPPSDAIRFAVRDVFDPNKLGRAEMFAEFQQQVGLRETLAASGIEPTTIKTAGGQLLNLDLPFFYFMASYEEASPTQAYEMLHRLRPNRVNRYPLPNPGGAPVFPAPVDIATVRSLLKEKDYNPIWRDRLAAISYRMPGRIDIRNMYRRGVFGVPAGIRGLAPADPNNNPPVQPAERELYERYLDLGYNNNDAASLTNLDAIEYERLARGKSQSKEANNICRAYKLGAYTYEEAQRLLERTLGTRDAATEFLNRCDFEMRTRDLEIAVSGVKKHFLSGEINGQTAVNTLLSYGVHAKRANEMVTTWRILLTTKRREASASDVVKWFSEGILTLGNMRLRLTNLGYDPEAVNMMVRHAQLGVLAKSTKERDKLARAEARERERLRQLALKDQREARSAEEKRLARFFGGRTEKNLKDWWKAGEISESEVRNALLFKGWNDSDVTRWLNVNRPSESGVGGGTGSEE